MDVTIKGIKGSFIPKAMLGCPDDMLEGVTQDDLECNGKDDACDKCWAKFTDRIEIVEGEND